MHTVAVLALEDVILFDLGTPVEVFGRARLLDGRPAYRVLVAGPDPEVAAGPVTVGVPHGLDALETADTVIVPGLNDPLRPVPDEVVAALVAAHAAGTRLASICVGSFTLAATGLLDGRRATTHWRSSELLAARFPAVEVDAAALFVDEGQVLTSAGASAGIDLCLHLVRRDHGAAVAADAARSAVLPLTRSGGQAQFIVRDALGAGDATLSATLAWIEDHAHRPLSLQEIADQAGVSTRTLNRRFREQTNMTPLEWLGAARIRLAQSLLETTSHPVERIAHQTGFGSAANFRAKFRAALDTSPAAYRLAFATYQT